MVDNSDIMNQVSPKFRPILESKLEDGEEILVMADAVVPPCGQAIEWVPFVGRLAGLGRAIATKNYALVVTKTRFWIVGVNKFARFTDVRMTSFEAFPISDIRTTVTDTKYFDGLIFKDTLKINTFSGKKYEFRGMNKETGDLVRDSIIEAQEGAQT